MYIPIGPSKKDLYKIIIVLLLTLLSFTSLKSCAKAYTQSQYINGCRTGTNNIYVTDEISGSYYSRQALNTSCNQYTPFNDIGNVEGNLIFSFVTWNNNNPTTAITGVEIASDGLYQCDIGSVQTYYDNQTQITIYSANCPVKFNSYGLRNIIFTRTNNTGTTGVTLGELATFVSKNETQVNVNQQEVVNAINNSQQQMVTQIQTQTQSINDIKDIINDSSIDNSSATDFKNNSAFQDSNGLDAIIKAPLNFIQSLTSSTCSSISLTIPYINADVSLPCMSTIYNKALGQQLVNLIALVINGVVLYRYCLKILQIVKDAKNPNKDGLEVLDL